MATKTASRPKTNMKITYHFTGQDPDCMRKALQYVLSKDSIQVKSQPGALISVAKDPLSI